MYIYAHICTCMCIFMYIYVPIYTYKCISVMSKLQNESYCYITHLFANKMQSFR